MEEEKKDDPILTYRVNHGNTDSANLRIGTNDFFTQKELEKNLATKVTPINIQNVKVSDNENKDTVR